MENSVTEIKRELIYWIENLNEVETLKKILQLKNDLTGSSLISGINSEKIVKNTFDEQFAAGMTSDELLENIAAHIGSIGSEGE